MKYQLLVVANMAPDSKHNNYVNDCYRVFVVYSYIQYIIWKITAAKCSFCNISTSLVNVILLIQTKVNFKKVVFNIKLPAVPHLMSSHWHIPVELSTTTKYVFGLQFASIYSMMPFYIYCMRYLFMLIRLYLQFQFTKDNAQLLVQSN